MQRRRGGDSNMTIRKHKLQKEKKRTGSITTQAMHKSYNPRLAIHFCAGSVHILLDAYVQHIKFQIKSKFIIKILKYETSTSFRNQTKQYPNFNTDPHHPKLKKPNTNPPNSITSKFN